MGLAATARIRSFNALSLGNPVHAGAYTAQGECKRSHELPLSGLRPAINEAGPFKRRVPNALSKLKLMQRGTSPFVAQRITRFALAPVSAIASQHPDQGSTPEHIPFRSSSQKGAACGRDSRPTEKVSEEGIADEAQGNLAQGGYEDPTLDLSRSQLVRGLLLGLGACGAGCLTEGGQNAQATGLILFPPAKLTNEYFLVRAGESEVEAQGHIMTNPVAKTSMDSGLSKLGRQQILSTIRQLQDLGACNSNCWIWPSITQRAYQTAELVASAFTIGRNRIVPEYSFLDARGLGSYEGRSLAQIQEVYQSDMESAFYRPPPYVDGTPNESVQDVLVRVRQLMSILETQYQGDQVVIVSPDSDNLSVLQAALLGMDLRRHSTLAFRPGEVRKVVLNSEAPPLPTSGYFKCKQLPSRQWECAI